MMESSAALADLAADLQSPPVSTSVDVLRRLWEFDAIRFICKRPDGLEDHPELPVRIRGAFGRRLFEQAPAISRRGVSGASAYGVLFEPVGDISRALELGKPFVIRSWVERNALIIELRLFGRAIEWRREAVTAMLEGLEGGLAIKQDRGLRIPISVLDVLTRQEPLEALSFVPRSASLTFRTPVAIRHRQQHVTHPVSIIRSVVRRVESMARWQSVALELDHASLSETVDGLTIDDRELLPYSWQRYSMRGGDQPIKVMGQLGTLRISGKLASLVDYLQIAESCNTGSHAALGLGHFVLAAYP